VKNICRDYGQALLIILTHKIHRQPTLAICSEFLPLFCYRQYAYAYNRGLDVYVGGSIRLVAEGKC
jgi:hypothetical protein